MEWIEKQQDSQKERNENAQLLSEISSVGSASSRAAMAPVRVNEQASEGRRIHADNSDLAKMIELVGSPAVVRKARQCLWTEDAEVDFSACTESKLRSSRQSSAMEHVRSPIPDQRILSAAFGTTAQQNASSGKDIDDANEAALQEAIARSLQEKAFGILLQPEPEVIQVGAIHTTNHTASVVAHQSAVNREPSEVSYDERAEQMSMFAAPNNAFKEYLDRHNLQVIANPGRGGNCAIYALVQHIRQDLKSDSLDREVRQLRDLYDAKHPSDKDRMLYLDTANGGAAKTLVELVNERYGANIQIGVVEAGLEKEYPVTGKDTFPAGAGSSFTHRLVVWDQQGHYEAITAKPG